MSTRIHESHLSQINTRWSDILKANEGDGSDPSIAEAQRRILSCYSLPIQRYLLAATHDYQAAEDLAQDFAFRFVRGDLKNASPSRGRFRDYLKTILRNSVNDYYRRGKRENFDPLLEDPGLYSVDSLSESFNEDWRQEIIRRTWGQLEDFSKAKNNVYFVLLRMRATFPESSSSQIAQRLSNQIKKEFTPQGVRQTLKRARSKFCKLLVSEVANTLAPEATDDELQSELADLQLLKYTSCASD